MNAIVTLPSPVVESLIPKLNKWDREHAAFVRMLPQLLATHRGRFVAVHEETVVDSGDDKIELALRVLGKIGNCDIFVGRVTDEPAPIARSGVRREAAVSDNTQRILLDGPKLALEIG
jgi:hypothetical protein